MGSLRALLAEATQALSATSDTPELDARLLLQHCLHKDHAWLIAHRDHVPDPTQRRAFEQGLERRRRGEPIAYITSIREFWSLPLAVTPDVLVPRPETELLVERALAGAPADSVQRVADLGTGSGAVALAIATERPRWRLVATDVSPAAVAMARRNAAKLGVTNVEFRTGDWLSALDLTKFDTIVSNPPYVADADPCLSHGELAFEPVQALRAGVDGLDAVRIIANAAREHLRPGGRLILEHGHDQESGVASLLQANGFIDIVCHRDLAGHPRVTEARAPVRTSQVSSQASS